MKNRGWLRAMPWSRIPGGLEPRTSIREPGLVPFIGLPDDLGPRTGIPNGNLKPISKSGVVERWTEGNNDDSSRALSPSDEVSFGSSTILASNIARGTEQVMSQ